MIELVSQARCIACDVCIDVCPTNVFETTPEGIPKIAHQEDCQTCYLCEAYCPADALYVAPQAHEHVEVDEQTLIDQGLLGSYRKALGWGPGRNPAKALQELHVLRKSIGSEGTIA